MPGLIVGYSSSFVGEGEVGGYIGEFRQSTGSVALSGTAVKSVSINLSSSGSLTLEGTVTQHRVFQASGDILLITGGASPKQFSRTLTASFALIGAASWGIRTTHAYMSASGGLDFSGEGDYAREYYFTAEYSDIPLKSGLVVGSAIGFVGDSYVGAIEGDYYSLRFEGVAEISKQATRFSYLGFPAVGMQLSNAAVVNRSRSFTANLDEFDLLGTVGNPVRSNSSTVWMPSQNVGSPASATDSSVWEAVVPNEEETNESTGVTVWDVNVTSNATVSAGSNVW